MPLTKLVFGWLYLILFFSQRTNAQTQTYSYPFANGRADLPTLTAARYEPVSADYLIRNPAAEPAEVIIFQEIDEMEVYRVDVGQRTLLGKAGWLYPAYSLQFDQYPEFGEHHRTGFLFTVPARQTIHIQLVFSHRTSSSTGPFRPALFSRSGYGKFLDRRLAEHNQKHVIGLLFIGCVFIMFLYMAMQYVILRDRVLFLYALYVLLIILRSLASGSYLQAMDGWPLLRSAGFVSCFSLTFLYWSLAAYVLFMREYMQLKTRSRAYNRLFLGLIGIFTVYGLVDIFVTVDKYAVPAWQLIHRLADVSVLLFGVFTLHTLWRFYDSVTKYLFWGVVFFMLSGVASVINRIAWLDSSLVYDREVAIFVVGYLLEILTFALGIAQRHELVRREKIRYQAQLIEQLQENERNQIQLNTLRDEIARDLHDEMGSQLSSISILSQTTLRHVTDERARQRLYTIGQTARQVIDSMREVVWSLNSGSDSLQNVALRIRETAHLLFDDTNTQLVVSMPDTIQTLNLTARQRRDLFLIAKESLTNIVRHANANRVWLALRQTPDGLVLSIADNGVGFDTSQSHSGLGMVSLRQRATQFGGLLRIETEPGRGTLIQLTYPDPTLAKPTIDQPKKQTVKQL